MTRNLVLEFLKQFQSKMLLAFAKNLIKEEKYCPNTPLIQSYIHANW